MDLETADRWAEMDEVERRGLLARVAEWTRARTGRATFRFSSDDAKRPDEPNLD